MKTLMRSFLYFILLSVVLVSCSDDDANDVPQITSLTISKTSDVVFGESLTVHAYAKDDNELTYAWEVSGGQITGEGKDVSWTAPNQCGTYTVKVTVSDGKETVDFERDVEVVGSYYFQFTEPDPTWAYISEVTTRGFHYGYMSVEPKAEKDTAGNYVYNPKILYNAPISVRTRIAVDRDSVVAGTNPRIQLTYLLSDVSNANSFLKTINLYMYPVSDEWKIRIMTKSQDGSVSYSDLASDSNGSLKSIFSQSKDFHDVSLSITADKTLILVVDGQEWYRTDALSTDSTITRDVVVENYIYYVYPRLSLWVDNFYLTTDGTILK